LQGAHPIYVTQNPDLQDTLRRLHQQNNHGQDTQTEIDRYLLLLSMEAQKSNLLAMRPWQNFILETDQVINVNMLPDLGALVRETLNINNTQPLTALSRIMQYSMPFIKHNRMSFPACDGIHQQQLLDIVQIVLCCVLGLIPRTHSVHTPTKKPLFLNRVQLFYTIWNLLLSGDKHNLYNFCNRYVQIVRLALLEYFLYFLCSNMPVEKKILCHVFKIELEIDEVCQNLLDLIDSFRQSAFSCTNFTWSSADEIAHGLNERCNRLCKGKSKFCATSTTNANSAISRHFFRQWHLTQREIGNATDGRDKLERFFLHHDLATSLHQAMQLAQFQYNNNHLTNMAGNTCLFDAGCIAHIHQRITIFSMPYNLHVQQLKVLGKALQLQSLAGSKVFWLYYCLACDLLDREGIDRRMRLGVAGQIYCSKCHTCEFVVAINTLGRFVKIGKSTYFFCMQCMKVHAWNQMCADVFKFGSLQQNKLLKTRFSEADTTEEMPQPSQPPLPSFHATQMSEEKCALCVRTLNLNRICLLHVRMAFLYYVHLCPRHTPLCNAMPMINTMPDLMLAVRNKLDYVSHFDGRYR
jgi:hypothetical protein